jgi:putative spermidine/putrescine transport system permease protein
MSSYGERTRARMQDSAPPPEPEKAAVATTPSPAGESPGLPSRSRASRGRWLLCLPLVLLYVMLLGYPLALLLRQSVQMQGGLGLGNYLLLFSRASYRNALIHSITLSALVASLSTVVCLAPAWLFANERFPGKRMVRAIFTLPMSFSGIIVGFLTVIMFGRIGALPQLFERLTGKAYTSGWAYQLAGLMLAYLYFEIPRATLTLEAALRKFDPQLSAAARSLGANTWHRLCFLILPLIWRPLVSTFAVTFTVSLGSFGVALILSKRFSVLPLEIFQQITGYGNNGLMAAMAIVLVLLAFMINYSARTFGAATRNGA